MITSRFKNVKKYLIYTNMMLCGGGVGVVWCGVVCCVGVDGLIRWVGGRVWVWGGGIGGGWVGVRGRWDGCWCGGGGGRRGTMLCLHINTPIYQFRDSHYEHNMPAMLQEMNVNRSEHASDITKAITSDNTIIDVLITFKAFLLSRNASNIIFHISFMSPWPKTPCGVILSIIA